VRIVDHLAPNHHANSQKNVKEIFMYVSAVSLTFWMFS